jgi:hypothetical protein
MRVFELLNTTGCKPHQARFAIQMIKIAFVIESTLKLMLDK